MKRPQPDINEITLQNYLGTISNIRKFRRLWGTTTVNGIEVLKLRQYYYPDSAKSDNFEDLFRYLGMYDAVTSSSTKGISSAWFYLNRNNGVALTEPYENFVSDNLNILWWDNADGPRPAEIKLTTSIVINHLKRTANSDGVYEPNGIISPSMSVTTLKSLIKNNYDDLWDLCSISHSDIGIINKGVTQENILGIVRNVVDSDDLSPADPWLNSLSRHVLKSNSGVPCTIKDVKIGYTQENWDSPKLASTYIVTLEIPEFLFTPTTGIVVDIADALGNAPNPRFNYNTALKRITNNDSYTQQRIKGMSAADLDTDTTLVTRPYISWDDAGIGFENLWVKANNTWYLRADPFTNPDAYGFSLDEFNSYIISLIDSDYRKKKPSFWQRAFAFLVFVVAFVFAPVTGGSSLSAAQVIAAKLIFASVVVTLSGVVLAATGNITAANAFFTLSKALEPFVIVASVYLAVTSFLTISAEKVGTLVGKSAAEVTLVDKVLYAIETQVDTFIDSIIEGATDLFTGTISSQSLAFTNKLVKLYTLGEQIKLEKIQDRNKELQSEYEDLEKELSQEQNILEGYSHLYARPATADWSIYASLFDQPYERGGGPLHIGNIQRTTKQAMRKTSYDDPAFTGILII